MPTRKDRPTGSQKLNAKRGGTKTVASRGPLDQIIKSLDRRGIDHNIIIKGIPIPDVIKGTFTARDPGQVSSALTALLSGKNIQYKPIKIFPIGIPVIDQIRVEVEGKLQR